MRKYFWYEFKKNLWAFVLLSVICAVPYLATVSTMELFWGYWSENGTITTQDPSNPNVSLVNWFAIMLCFITPMLVYSFKMNKRGVDAYYALPIKREKLYFVRTVMGVLLVLIPYTVSYWLGFVVLLCRTQNIYNMGYYVPGYFIFIAYMVLLFGTNAFIYTRANKPADGVVLMLAYALIGSLAVEYVSQLFHTNFQWRSTENVMTFGGANAFTDNLSAWIRGKQCRWDWTMFVFPDFYGVSGYTLLFLSLKKDRGENAEQVCESWFGYKLLIPLYIALYIGAVIENLELLNICIITVCGIVATALWRRKFRFSWKYWLLLAGAVALGIMLGLLCQLTVLPDVNLPQQSEIPCKMLASMLY